MLEFLKKIIILILIYDVRMTEICHNDSCHTQLSSIEIVNKTSVNCFCSECDQYNDCCRDLRQSTLKNINECNIKLHESFSVYSIGKCASWFPSDKAGLKSKCENDPLKSDNDIFNYIPVYSNQTNSVYKNIFCAQCNIKNFDMTSLNFFSMVPKSSEYESLDENENENEFSQKQLIEYFVSDKFKIEFESPVNVNLLRYCVKSIDSCSANSSDVERELCNEEPTAFRYTFDKAFKNRFCALCNGFKEEDLLCFMPRPRISASNKGKSLQVLFDLSQLYNEIVFNLNININGKIMKESITSDCDRTNASKNKNETFEKLMCDNVHKLNINMNLNINTNENKKETCNENTSDFIKQYMTICGQCLSILSLLLLLIMYFSNKLLRNLPGKILICLSLSLLFSQVMFLISIYITKPYVYYQRNQTECNYDTTIENRFKDIDELLKNIFFQLSTDCYFMGMLTHYFHLSFFSWSNIMAYDLYKMFTMLSTSKNSKHSSKSIANDENENKKMFVKYSFYGWLLPLIIVACLFLSQFIMIRLAYSFKTCFISNQIDLFIYFVLPVCILLSLNIYFLIFSIKSIRGVDKLSKKYLRKDYDSNKNHEEASSSLTGNQSTTTYNKKNMHKSDNKGNNNDKKRLVLFTKLFILTGMTWLIGLFTSFLENSFIWYIYIFLNSFQGFFIFAAYAFTPQTQKNVANTRLYRTVTSLLSNGSNSMRSRFHSFANDSTQNRSF